MRTCQLCVWPAMPTLIPIPNKDQLSSQFLGGIIGNEEDVNNFLIEKVDIWAKSAEKLELVAQHEPSASFVALTKSLQNEYTFVQTVVVDSEIHFSSLRQAIKVTFPPSLFGSLALEADIICRLSRYEGIGILGPVKSATPQFLILSEATSYLSTAIGEGSKHDLECSGWLSVFQPKEMILI